MDGHKRRKGVGWKGERREEERGKWKGDRRKGRGREIEGMRREGK